MNLHPPLEGGSNLRGKFGEGSSPHPIRLSKTRGFAATPPRNSLAKCSRIFDPPSRGGWCQG